VWAKRASTLISFFKGNRELIAAWPKVLASVPDAALTIVGHDDAMADHQKQAAFSENSAERQKMGEAGYDHWFHNFRYSNFKKRCFAELTEYVNS